MRKSISTATVLITIVLLVCGLWCWFVPIHTTNYTSYSDSENAIVANPNVKAYEDILFPADSFNQEVFVGFASSAGNFTLLMLTQENLQNYTENRSYSALLEAINVTSISETVNLTEPTKEWITIVLFSTVDDLHVQGGIGTQCDVYYRWLATIFFALAVISFATVIIPSTLKRIRKE